MCKLNKLSLIIGIMVILGGSLLFLVAEVKGDIPSIYAQAGNHSAKLSWNSPPGDSLLGYNIYRKLLGETTFEKIDYTISDTFYVDIGLTNDTLYSYFVTAVNPDSTESDSSQVVDVLPNNWIIFVEDWDIWRMDAVDANGDSVGDNRMRLTNSTAIDLTPDLSPDGRRIVFSTNRDGNFELYSMNSLDGMDLTKLTSNTYSDVSPSWSYDGSRIAYSSDQFCNYDIFVMESKGSGITQLTTNPGYDGNPDFSPCGDQLAYDTQSDSVYQIYRMDIDEPSQSECITDSLEDDAGCPHWSPDAISIVLCSRAQEAEWKEMANPMPTFHILTMDTDGVHGSNLTMELEDYGFGHNMYPVYLAPDFSLSQIGFIYFSSDKDGDCDIHIIEVERVYGVLGNMRFTLDDIENSPTGGMRQIQPEIIPPACPDSVSADTTRKSLGVILSWSGNKESDLAYYSVYRDTISGFIPNDTLATLMTTSYLDTNVTANTVYFYIITAADSFGSESGYSGQVKIKTNSSVEEIKHPNEIAQKFALSPNYPNPFNSTTVIRYRLSVAKPFHTALRIYNIRGERVRELVDKHQKGGHYEVTWDGKDSSGQDVASGVYFYRLEVKSQRLKITRTRKMVLLR